MENQKSFFTKKSPGSKEPYFEVDVSNGFRLKSIIPLKDEEDSIYIIENQSIVIDIKSIAGINQIDFFLREHFNYAIKTYPNCIIPTYPYTIEYIKAVVK